MADRELIGETKRQIRRIVIEIDKLTRQDVTAGEFYRLFLDRVVHCLAARGGAVWTVDDAGDLKLAYQRNFPDALRQENDGGFERHAELLRKTLSDGAGALVPPHRDQIESDQLGNPTDSLLVVGVLKVDRRPKGVVEIFQRVGAPRTAQRGYLKFLSQMCELASQYLQNHR